jgi:hypothetical protein
MEMETMALDNDKQQKINTAAENLFKQQMTSRNPDWVVFYRRVMSRHGLIYHAYPSMDDRMQFEKTELYRRIQWMVAELRKKTVPTEASQNDTKVITVRIPTALHEALGDEARDHGTSVNKLCISKLLQFIEAERIPSPLREQSPEEMAWMEDALYSEAVFSGKTESALLGESVSNASADHATGKVMHSSANHSSGNEASEGGADEE